MTKERKRKLAEAQARWRANNPDYYKKWLKRGENAEKHVKYCKRYYREHREELKDYAKEYYARSED